MAITIQSLGLLYYSYNIYNVDFYGDVVTTLVTHTPRVVDTWISDMECLHFPHLHNLAVGLNIEWGNNYNTPSILQLCIRHNCLIIQFKNMVDRYSIIPPSLVNFLCNPAYKFAGFGPDMTKLYNSHGFWVTNMVDLNQLAHALGTVLQPIPGLNMLALEVLGKEIDKPWFVTSSNWNDLWLNPYQIMYACVDAYAMFEIGRRLNAGSVSFEPMAWWVW